MKKVKINYYVDWILFLSGIISIISGIVLLFTQKGKGVGQLTEIFLGLTKHTWGEIHQWSGIVLAIFVIIHFILHWKWFWGMTGKLLK